MDENWVNVYSGATLFRMEIFKDVLESNGISSVILNKKDSAFLTGPVELYVHKDNEEKARKIISEAESK